MLKIYLRIAWRNLAKNKLYSLVNIGGLTIGIASCILVGLYVSNELNYDRFNKNADRIVRVTTEYTVNGTINMIGTTSSMPGPRLAATFPQIESYVRIRNRDPYVVRYGEKTFVEPRFYFADSTFFKMFSFPLIEGDVTSALNQPGKIVISQSMERKYFGNARGLGKLLLVGGTKSYIVSGVAKDAPVNSQIKFNFIASYASLPNANTPSWNVEIYTTYFLLHNPQDRPGLEKNIADYMKAQKDIGMPGNDYLIFHLEPLTRVHLYSTLNTLEPNGNITYIYVLIAVALLILCIACVNYTNLATAQSVSRTPEIGIRKVLGSAKWQLFLQFIGESCLLNFIAFILAVALAISVLPLFNALVERPLDLALLSKPFAIGLMILLFALISFASGAYPSFILSNIKLIKVLKSGFSFSAKGGGLRKSLIVFQFIVSVFLIISTTIIFQQLSYIQHKKLGYDKDHLIVLPVDGIMRANYQPIKDALGRVPGVISVSSGYQEITNIGWPDALRTSPSAAAAPLLATVSPTDIDFVRTTGVEIIAGSDYSLSDWKQLDSSNNDRDRHTSYLLNESAVKALGWTPDQIIGKTLYLNFNAGIVKAVVKDFHFAPLHEPIKPLVIFLDSGYSHIYQCYAKISGQNIPATLQALNDSWRSYVPHRPFQYHFLDDNYNMLYHSEQQTAKIFSAFSMLAIFLACLGLFALAGYTTVQRAKEIGIRKVLGAEIMQIAMLISKDFVKLVAIASLIAFPVAWLSMNSWLQSFAYRISINWWVFLAAGVATSSIALLTISFQAIRAANMNPIKSLKRE
ncbi:MAG TPA: ABC transporter permease [Puia sp.]|jgi:putative ABC transport system permease protein|nr:ABC transporter permease [Puia sp.]